jgi:hypothetical protein
MSCRRVERAFALGIVLEFDLSFEFSHLFWRGERDDVRLGLEVRIGVTGRRREDGIYRSVPCEAAGEGTVSIEGSAMLATSEFVDLRLIALAKCFGVRFSLAFGVELDGRDETAEWRNRPSRTFCSKVRCSEFPNAGPKPPLLRKVL